MRSHFPFEACWLVPSPSSGNGYLATETYVGMVLSSVGLYVGSRFLGSSSPSWYPIALAGLNLGSTYLAYRVRSKAREE